MNIYSPFSLTAFLLNYFLIYIILKKNRKKEANRIFALFLFCISLFNIGEFLMETSSSINLVILGAMIYGTGAIFIAPTYLHFTLVFPKRLGELKNKFIILMYLPGIILFIQFIHLLSLDPPIATVSGSPVLGLKNVIGGGLLYFGVIFIFFYTLGGAILWIKYKKTNAPVERIQLGYVFLGTILPAIAGINFEIIYPLLYNVSLPVGRFASIVETIILSYVILRYEFLEIAFKKPEIKGLERSLAKFTKILGDSALVIYKTTVDYVDIVEDIAWVYLNRGRNVVLVTTVPRTNIYHEKFETPIKTDALKLVNMSFQSTSSTSSGLFVDVSAIKPKVEQESKVLNISMTRLEYFTEILEKIPKDGVIIFDSLSMLILQRGASATFKFITETVEQTINKQIGFIVFLNEEAHEKREISSFLELFINIVRISKDKLEKIK